MTQSAVTLSLRRVFLNGHVRQAAILYASLAASLVLGILVSVINTRLLGPEQFGDFKFLQTIWSLSVLFVTFGFFTTGGILLANKQTGYSEQATMGGLLAITAVASLLMIAGMYLLSYPLGDVYGEQIGSRIRLYAGLLFVFPLQALLQETLRGTNKITSLAALAVMPQLLYIPSAILGQRLFGFSLDLAILLYLISICLTVLVITLRIKPDFSRVVESVGEILGNNRALGHHIYIAVLATTASTQLSQFTLAYFFDTRLVGIFSLAITITMPLTMVPSSIATTYFRHFANADAIPKKIILAAILLSVLSLLAFSLLIRDLVTTLYTDKFLEVVTISYICAVAALMRGMGDLFNRYLLARGKTTELRVNAIQLSVINIAGYCFLVYEWGLEGAATTKLAVDFIYCASMWFYYRRVTAGINCLQR